jgi:hypothetical protein
LSAAQRRAVKAAMVTMTRDFGFIKLVHDQTKDGWLKGPADEGRPL